MGPSQANTVSAITLSPDSHRHAISGVNRVMARPRLGSSFTTATKEGGVVCRCRMGQLGQLHVPLGIHLPSGHVPFVQSALVVQELPVHVGSGLQTTLHSPPLHSSGLVH